MLGALGMRVLVAKGRRVSLLPVQERSRGLLVHEGSRVVTIRPGIDESCRSGWADVVLPLPAARTYEEGLPPDTGILGFWDSSVPVNGRTGEDTVRSSTARYRPEEPISASGSYTGTSRFTGKPERPEYG